MLSAYQHPCVSAGCLPLRFCDPQLFSGRDTKCSGASKSRFKKRCEEWGSAVIKQHHPCSQRQASALQLLTHEDGVAGPWLSHAGSCSFAPSIPILMV